jgi:hypothetical protein
MGELTALRAEADAERLVAFRMVFQKPTKEIL